MWLAVPKTSSICLSAAVRLSCHRPSGDFRSLQTDISIWNTHGFTWFLVFYFEENFIFLYTTLFKVCFWVLRLNLIAAEGFIPSWHRNKIYCRWLLANVRFLVIKSRLLKGLGRYSTEVLFVHLCISYLHFLTSKDVQMKMYPYLVLFIKLGFMMFLLLFFLKFLSSI